jgi:hypothetical protein
VAGSVAKRWTASVARLEVLAEEIRSELKNTSKSIIVIGEKLIEAKAEIARGDFTAWAEKETGLTYESARRFMRVAERFGGKTEIISVLPPTILYLLAAPSTSDAAIDEVIDRAAAAMASPGAGDKFSRIYQKGVAGGFHSHHA